MLLDPTYRIYEAVYKRDGLPSCSVTVDAFPDGPNGRPEWHVWLDHYERHYSAETSTWDEQWCGDDLKICHTRAEALRVAERWCDGLEADGHVNDYCDIAPEGQTLP